MHPVDVEGLGLHDYYEVVQKPMDFGIIKSKMEAKDGTGYKNVREIYSDVRLVFKNAMKYNDERQDVHIMAKTLLENLRTDCNFCLKLMKRRKDWLRRKQSRVRCEAGTRVQLATGGGGGDIGKKINHGGGEGGDDGADDDDYFDDFDDDGEGEEGGLFRSFLKRPTTSRFISRTLPQGMAWAFIGRMLADPAFLYRLLLEEVATIGSSVWWEVKNRKDRIKQEWDLALINVLTVTACNALVVWSLAPRHSYGNTFWFDLQNTLQKLPNNIFERSYPLREFDLQKRIHSLCYKAAELSIVGLTAEAVQGSLSNILSSIKKEKYQLLCGFDQAMVSHFDVIGVALLFSTAVRVYSVSSINVAGSQTSHERSQQLGETNGQRTPAEIPGTGPSRVFGQTTPTVTRIMEQPVEGGINKRPVIIAGAVEGDIWVCLDFFRPSPATVDAVADVAERPLGGRFKGANPSLTVTYSRTRYISGKMQIRTKGLASPRGHQQGELGGYNTRDGKLRSPTMVKEYSGWTEIYTVDTKSQLFDLKKVERQEEKKVIDLERTSSAESESRRCSPLRPFFGASSSSLAQFSQRSWNGSTGYSTGSPEWVTIPSTPQVVVSPEILSKLRGDSSATKAKPSSAVFNPENNPVPRIREVQWKQLPIRSHHHVLPKDDRLWRKQPTPNPLLQESLSGLAIRWYNQLSRSHIKAWKDLAKLFLEQYKHVNDMRPDRAIKQGEIKDGEASKKPPMRDRDGEIKNIHHVNKGVTISSPKSTAAVPSGTSKQDFREPRKEREHFDPIPMTYKELYRQLLDTYVVSPYLVEPMNLPYPKWYNENAHCEYHGGVLRHTIENCYAFKIIVQKMRNQNWINFNNLGASK
ncbi:GNS1/SUR4 membrane protein family [Hibiscus syriacus]|uniref:GNS1/SUR4 membrane protein family n=1 Tax=Hibiscus syriacus TaxID=106335 RepID=A0A6A2Y4F6_HIBSY|nr:GNS1/SUR4 membrane protein family [Hibiscus syriacus]